MKPLKALLANILNLVIPPACLVCGDRLEEQSEVICAACEAKINPVDSNVCSVCGSVLSSQTCEVCLDEQFAFDSAKSLFKFQGPVKDLIHTLKYNGYTSPAGYFALPLADLIEAEPGLQQHDYICAVPLHTVRQRDRGYNQSELIAWAAAAISGLPYRKPIVRSLNTLSQTMLSKAKRIKNLDGAFRIKDLSMVTGKKIILVDDVFTTGSTLNEIAKTLRRAGASKITALTIARA